MRSFSEIIELARKQKAGITLTAIEQKDLDEGTPLVLEALEIDNNGE